MTESTPLETGDPVTAIVVGWFIAMLNPDRRPKNWDWERFPEFAASKVLEVNPCCGAAATQAAAQIAHKILESSGILAWWPDVATEMRTTKARKALTEAAVVVRDNISDKAVILDVTGKLAEALPDTDRAWVRWVWYARQHGVEV